MIIVTERKLKIPRSDFVVGYAGDNLVEIRNFKLSRFYGDIDLSLFDFKLDTQVGNVKNIIDLAKVVAEDTIMLTWTIEESHVLYSGHMAIQLRAFHGEVEKWHSAQEYVLVMPSINPASAQPDVLPSEFEQMEVRLTALANSAETDAETATTQAGIATTKAQEASDSAAAALASEQAAKTSEDAAKGYAEAAESAAEAANTALAGKQSTSITDAGGYFTVDTVEGALQEIGAQLSGLDEALEALL